MANVQFSIRVSYLEVYQEELNDLLHMTTPSQDIHIRENEKGHTCQSLVYSYGWLLCSYVTFCS